MLIEIEWHPTGRQLRVFGVGGLLASIAAALMLHFVWGEPRLSGWSSFSPPEPPSACAVWSHRRSRESSTSA